MYAFLLSSNLLCSEVTQCINNARYLQMYLKMILQIIFQSFQNEAFVSCPSTSYLSVFTQLVQTVLWEAVSFIVSLKNIWHSLIVSLKNIWCSLTVLEDFGSQTVCVEIAADLAIGGYAAPVLAEPFRVAPTASFLSIRRGYSFRLWLFCLHSLLWVGWSPSLASLAGLGPAKALVG